MYRIVLACSGVPADVGPSAARDITEEFTHRPWHKNVRCQWDGSRLVLQADNDFDSNGLALLDEFPLPLQHRLRMASTGVSTLFLLDLCPSMSDLEILQQSFVDVTTSLLDEC